MASRKYVYLLLLSALIAVFVLQLACGSVSIPFDDFLSILTGKQNNQVLSNIVLQSRLPSAVAAIFSGAGLAVSGLMMQTMFRNPVAGPYVLGITSGAMLGVALLVLGSGFWGISESYRLHSPALILSAAIGASFVFLLVFFISLRVSSVVSMLIIGLMIGGAISAVVEVLQSLSGSNELKNYLMWTFGSFRYVNTAQMYWLIGIVSIGLSATLLLSKSLNLLLLGDAYAETSGLNLRAAKLQIIFLTSLLAGTVTSFCGPIGFVGLAVPHISRKLMQTANHRILLPSCMLIGAIVCGLANVAAALPGSDKILPLNALMNILSAPVVIWIIMKHNRHTW